MSIFPTKILLATDGSKDAQLAAQTATDLANSTNSELHVLSVGLLIPMPLAYARLNQQQVERETWTLLDKQVEKVRSFRGTVTQTHLGLGDPAAEIVALAEEIGAGLIALGGRGHGKMRRALMGSVSRSVVRNAHCPVVVVRKERPQREAAGSSLPTKIVLATDGSEEATLAARTAADIAQRTGSELHVAYATPVPVAADPSFDVLRVSKEAEESVKKRAQQFLDEQLKQLEADGGSVAQSHARIGRPDEEIITLADELGAGLIVLGSRGLGGIRRLLLGSVSDSVVRHAHCPVMVVRKEKR